MRVFDAELQKNECNHTIPYNQINCKLTYSIDYYYYSGVTDDDAASYLMLLLACMTHLLLDESFISLCVLFS